ncbi:MAG: DUF3772 domain-containing protein [Dokdonella sp.]
MTLILRFLIFLLFTCAALPARAQTSDSTKFFDDARQQIVDIRKDLGGKDVDDAKLNGLRDAVAALTVQADAIVSDRAPKLDALQARLTELGPAPAKGVSEAPDIASQRADLVKQSDALDAEIKRAKLLVVDSQQVTAEIAETRRATFQATLSQRTSSPLTPTFWWDVGSSLERDGTRFAALRDGAFVAVRDGFSADNRAFAFGGLGLGLLLIVVGRWWAERRLMRMTADRVPQGPLRRSALAFAVVLVATVFTGFGAQVIVSGLNSHGAFSDAELTLARAIISAVFFGSFVAGLGRALLSSRRPSWRLPQISDDSAQRLRMFPLLLGYAVAISVLQKRVNTLVGASLSATIAGTLAIAVLYSVLIGWGLLRARAVPVDVTGKGSPRDPPQRSVWVGLGVAALWIGVVATWVAALTGYVALAHQIARQMMALGIVVATFYLLVHLIEDLFAAAVSARASWAERTFGLEPRALDQIAELCSGLFRVCAVLLAIVAALAPFGTGPSELVARLAQAGAGFKIGQIEVTPDAVFGAIAVFVLGLSAVRMLKHWLFHRYLPTTRLDPAMRVSVTTLLGYVGGVVVFALALAKLGFSLERIAWVASALSVGIGFGLQAVVQNFVSGLILLIERPVKVGDWVVLGDTEGDIRRINVRATEIQMSDRSTVIVPNSELITKSVRNVTLANAEGRVRIRLPMPLVSDADRVRQHMRDALAAHPGVLQTPAPSVLLDGVEGMALIFIAIAYIANPRQAGSVRSDLLFDILARLRAEQIALSTPYSVKLDALPRWGGDEAGAPSDEHSG